MRNILIEFQMLGAYSVSKTALFGLTKALSQDLAGDNIRVNGVAPGVIRTKFASALHESETAKELLLSTVPLRRYAYYLPNHLYSFTLSQHISKKYSPIRLGEPENIAGVVAFLASDDAAYITGETIVAAGGMTSRL